MGSVLCAQGIVIYRYGQKHQSQGVPAEIGNRSRYGIGSDGHGAAAVKTVQIGIRYDAPAIEAITFTTHSGKVYK